MDISNSRIETSEFPVIKGRFIKLINDGKEFGEKLIREKKSKTKTISTALNTPFDLANDAKAEIQKNESVAIGSMKKFIQQIFMHFDVNPSIKENTIKINETYVKENLHVIDYFQKRLLTVNKDDNLYYKILELFKRIREDGNIHQEDRKIYITGIRGAGKTSYLNYFISEYEHKLNALQIISVRINVLRIRDNISLENAIKFKICRILFTYYCTFRNQKHERLEKRSIKDNMDKYLTEIIQEQNNNFCENDIIECADYFKRYNSKEPTELNSKHNEICDLLLDNIYNEYNFIIMLDNFDQVNTNHKEKYEKRKRELKSITESRFFDKSIYIIAIRYSTFNTLDNMSRAKSVCSVIGTPSTYDMLTKRINYFANKDSSLSIDIKIKFLKNLIILFGNNFITSSYNTNSNPLDFQQSCNLFDDIFYGDKRMILNMLYRFVSIVPEEDFDLLLGSDYDKIMDKLFDRLIAHTYYKFFESLLIDVNTGYCNSFFEYKIEAGMHKFSQINAAAFFDENFFPNIYRFAAIPYHNESQFVPFIKIRILQLLCNIEKISYNRLNQKEMAPLLKDIFGYNLDLINIAIEELRWDQSIILLEKEPDSQDNTVEELKTKKLAITSRGKKLLDILPTNINILAVSLEQMFFPIEFAIDGGIPIGNYNDANISKFIIRNKFYSLPKTIGLLKSMEEYEKKVLMTRATDTNKKFFNLDSDFSITSKLEEIALESIQRIYFSYFDNYEDDTSKYNNRRNELKAQLEL